MCLGQNLAKHELLITIAAILHRFDISLPAGKMPESTYTFSLATKPYTVKLSRR